MPVYIDLKGTIRRPCLVCGQLIATRGYSYRIYKHNLNGKPCTGVLGARGDDRIDVAGHPIN